MEELGKIFLLNVQKLGQVRIGKILRKAKKRRRGGAMFKNPGIPPLLHIVIKYYNYPRCKLLTY